MLIRILARAKIPFLSPLILPQLNKTLPINPPLTSLLNPNLSSLGSNDIAKPTNGFSLILEREYHDGRPRGPLWRGKKLIGKEALFVILGLKRFKDDEEKLDKFVKNHVLRLLKMDMIAVLSELQRQDEVSLALKMFRVIQKQDWYHADTYLYKDLIIAMARSKRMDDVTTLWEDMKKENLFPDSQTYTEVIRGFLRDGSPADAMNTYEDMLKAPELPAELPFRILMKGLLPHPLLRNKVKKNFEELFPEHSVYDPPQEIFGMR
ncbi:pentatricopeptide repeat-containing protein At3g46870-like [Chenopodium quinoa]|uniref:Pentatricopeptide repeat-containing protein n=1 Tax=Chenopodium quinoa TaxID=63459 RepID=A0A803N1M6_CHEQI|nr:pentatricopeptide repeat-containing protein At3g46870-like [Chenopodium quinoa]XP_021715850.1 pentatricopeptide repeat-containing protein At3g46870-like [Chenopodium quinoa]